MPKDTKTLGNNKARACESLGFVHKKRLCQRFDTTSFFSLCESNPNPIEILMLSHPLFRMLVTILFFI